MIRKFALLMLAACGMWLVAADKSAPQPASSEWRGRCTLWNRPSFDRPGARFFVYPYEVNMDTALRGLVMDDPPVSGTFYAHGAFLIAFWSEPDGERPTLQFTTPYGIQMDFISDDGRTRHLAREGRLFELPAPLPPPVVCPSDLKPRPGVASPSRGPYVWKRVEVPAVKGSEELEEKTLDDLIKKHTKGLEPSDAGKRPKSLSEFASRPSETAPPETPAPKPATAPRRETSPGSQVVCGLNFKPMSAADDLKDMQTVGWRNARKEAEAYDYLAEAGAAYPLDAVADVAASVSKLVPYEAVGRQATMNKDVSPESAGRQADKLWISLKHSGALKPKASHRKPPPVSVRVIVVGGAPEVAMSGLDVVGAELSKQPGGRAAVSVDWYLVSDTGSLGPAQHFESLEDLIKGADERKGDGRPVPLGEIEIQALLDDLKAILIKQTQAVDRVFWIKGAYMVPSAIPVRFEEFIEAVTRNSAPVRSSGEWLTVVTARMPGFSIGYLRAPLTSKNVGDVIEEPTTELKPRRFISEAKVLAARLWARANARAAASPGEAAPGVLEPNGKLVFDAKDLFRERGYILSSDTVTALQQHLQSLWNMLTVAHSSVSWKEGVAELGKKTGKPAATIVDLLQNGDGRALARLPKGLPDWSRKDLRELNEADVSEVFKFVTRYQTKVDVTAKEVARQRDAHETNCTLLYLSEVQLGLE